MYAENLQPEVLSKKMKPFTFCKLKCILNVLTAGLCSSQCQKGMIIEKKDDLTGELPTLLIFILDTARSITGHFIERVTNMTIYIFY